MREEVRDILRRTGATAIFVTHDQEEAFFMGDRVAIMDAGSVAQVDLPETVFHSPVSLAVADFLGEASLLAGTVTPAGVTTALGLLPQNEPPAVDDRHVTVLVRPDDVELVADRDGTATIDQRVFRGMHYRYRVTLSSGETLKCLADHCVDLEPGSPVNVRIRACHPLACFVKGLNVTGGVGNAASVPLPAESTSA
jgi:iron(III) transport system ATP-binding protein